MVALSARYARHPMFWVACLYIVEGLPLGVFFELLPVFMRQEGASLPAIGSLSLLGLAWPLKFLWAPLVDRYRFHQRWMVLVQMGMALSVLMLLYSHNMSPWMWWWIGVFVVLAATNDVVIDGYTIEMLHGQRLGIANGLRISFYRVGLLLAGALLMVRDSLGWQVVWGLTALMLFLFALVCARVPRLPNPSEGKDAQATLNWPTLAAAALLTLCLVDQKAEFITVPVMFWLLMLAIAALLLLRKYAGSTPVKGENQEDRSWLMRPVMIPVLLFILFYKLPDSAMGMMVKPFWLDVGMSATAIGAVSVNLGLALSIAGGLTGGWLTEKLGIFRALWLLGLTQAMSNLGYAGVAWWFAATEPEQMSRLALYGASAVESFTGGLSTAAFLAFMMAIVKIRGAASQYALLSSFFLLSRSLAGWASGYGAEAWGYAPYFLLTAGLMLPAYGLLPWVRKMLESQNRNMPEQHT